jgi:hypothetical protein
MKLIRYILALLGTIMLFTTCDKEPELTDQQKAAYALSSNYWGGEGKVIVNVHPRGIDSKCYEDIHHLKLAFSTDYQYNPSKFEAKYGGVVFPGHFGSWRWVRATDTNSINIGSWSMKFLGHTYRGDLSNITSLTEFSLIPANNPVSISFKFYRYGPDSLKISGEYMVTLQKGASKSPFGLDK